jgi:hypothetical protein
MTRTGSKSVGSWVATFAFALAAACATAPQQSLTDGRSAAPPPTPANPTPASIPDAGIQLPPDGAAAPSPTLTALAPSSALVGGVAPTITITGQNFLKRTVIELDGHALATSFVSVSSLSATLPPSLLATSGNHAVTVSTSAPGGGRSAPSTFAVDNPVATLTTIAPNDALINGAATPITITGTGFVTGSTVIFGTAALPTTYVSATQITATVPQASLATSGTIPIVVTNPLPGGGPSTRIAFTVANPTVTVTSITPTSATVGSAATTIAAVGTGFVSGSSVSFNGTAVPTTVSSATALTATVPATLLATTGNFPFVVTNPSPGGGVSVPVTFTVGNPDPTITTLTPSSAVAGANPTAVTVTGTGFVTASQVTFNGTASATTFVSATSLTATLTATQLATAGTIEVAVVNPAPGGGTSTPATFTVDNPTPVLTSISPASVAAGASDTTLTAFGSSFVSGSTVQANGTALATTFLGASELRAVVPAASLTTATTIAITVANPDPGGSTSSAQTLTVTAPVTTEDAGDDAGEDAGITCDPTGVDLALAGAGTTQTFALDYSFGPVARFYFDPTDLTESTCPVEQLSTSTSSYAAFVVQNTSGAPAFLEANAVCASTDVAFLAVYASTTTIPTADAERIACSGFVANGSSGGGNYSSTSAGGSQYCPGMTKANGASITLQPCDTAVVLVQPYDITQYTEPAQVVLDLSP